MSDKTWAKLMKWRIDLDCSTMDDLMDRMIKIIQFHKLGNEIKEQSK